jgi:dolichol-phosphate mannosyltransferase
VITGLRKIFYKLINKISDYELPEGAGDFMLLDRSVVDRLCRLKNKNPYLRGVIFGYGFKRVGVPYARNARLYGTSKFSASKLVRLAMDGIVSQSTFPLRLASLFGFVVAFVTFLISIYFLLAKLFWASSLPAGFTAIILVILFGVAFNAIFLGIVGEYLGRIYSQITQNEELTIIEEKTE